MNRRTLRFVNSRADAGPPERSTDIVVLDTSWTPGPGERPDLFPVRAAVRAVLERVNLFDESLERLDAWAAAAKLADRFLFEGASWWFHARSWVRLSLHELLLWRHVLDELAPPGSYTKIVIPVEREALVAAARAPGPSPTPRIVTTGHPAHVMRLALRVARRPVRRVTRFGGAFVRLVGLRRERARREAILTARITALRARPHGVLTVVRGPSFHVVESPEGRRHTDPLVAPVVRLLVENGIPVVTVATGMTHRRDADWKLIERDERLLPMSFVSRSWSQPDGEGLLDELGGVMGRAGIGNVPLRAGVFDLGRDFVSIMPDLSRWFARQRRDTLVAARLMRDLQPSALFTGWEGARTAWLAAARRLGIPSVAVQHGVIYPNSPDYSRPKHPGLVRPDVTCVFGPFERAVLIEQGRYEPSTVIVTGSPRVDPDEASIPASPDERAAVREQLGVVGTDRMLVVSGSRFAVGEGFHSIAMVSQLLGGPLPGIHVVFKLHPEEGSGYHYEVLLEGLARAGGYSAPRISIVRDIDLYRLLRAADAHLGQYSTVLTDAVLTGTPNMIAVGQAWADVIGYVDAKVAVAVRSVEDVRAFMEDPRPPAAEDRARFLDAHFRGGDAVARIVTEIQEVMKRAGPTSPVAGTP